MGFVLRRQSIISGWLPVIAIALGWSIPWFLPWFFPGFLFFNFWDFYYPHMGLVVQSIPVLIGGIVTAFAIHKGKALHPILSALGVGFGWLIAYVTPSMFIHPLINFFYDISGSDLFTVIATSIILGTIISFLGSAIMFAILRKQLRAVNSTLPVSASTSPVAQQHILSASQIRPFPWLGIGLVSLGLAIAWALNANVAISGSEFIWIWVIAVMIGGLPLGFVLRQQKYITGWVSAIGIALGCAPGMALSFIFSGRIFVPLAWFMYLLFGIIGGIMISLILSSQRAIHNWSSGLWITLGWGLAHLMGAVFAVLLQSHEETPFGIIVGAITGFLGSTIMFWVLRRQKRD
jgi:hypothetical protein